MRPDQASPRRHFFPPSKLRKLLLPVLLPISSSHPAAEALLLHSYVDVVFDPLNTHVGARSFRPTSSLAPYSAPQHPGLQGCCIMEWQMMCWRVRGNGAVPQRLAFRLVDQGKFCFNPIRKVYMVNAVKHGVMLKEAEEMISAMVSPRIVLKDGTAAGFADERKVIGNLAKNMSNLPPTP
ncbi:hypothetical protein OPV22_019105 [Ensete ventricosum]|uniref:Uncharacterized protein n=1 Tax=Ensete ventricosum TaxID=4639 RepID=A0AAV8QXD9_ENSVE|nr:hypothetical protein OPV22_019105 [Ensete ventricosum]